MSQIKLTSSELHEVITEAVKQILCLEDENQTNNYSIEEVKQLIINAIKDDRVTVYPVSINNLAEEPVQIDIFKEDNDSLAFSLFADINYRPGKYHSATYYDTKYWDDNIVTINDIEIKDADSNDIPFIYKNDSDEKFDAAIISCLYDSVDYNPYEAPDPGDDAYDLKHGK